MTEDVTDKRMKLRYAGACRLCGTDLPAGPTRSTSDRARPCDAWSAHRAPVAAPTGPVDPGLG